MLSTAAEKIVVPNNSFSDAKNLDKIRMGITPNGGAK